MKRVVVAILYTLISSSALFSSSTNPYQGSKATENRDAHGVWAVSSPAIVLLRGQFSQKILDFAPNGFSNVDT